jgi:hypothetical protein
MTCELISKGNEDTKVNIRPISKIVCKRVAILAPILLFGNAALAADAVCSSEGAMVATELAKHHNFIRRLRASRLAALGAGGVCTQSFYLQKKTPASTAAYVLAILCGLLVGYTVKPCGDGT